MEELAQLAKEIAEEKKRHIMSVIDDDLYLKSKAAGTSAVVTSYCLPSCQCKATFSVVFSVDFTITEDDINKFIERNK